MNRREVLKLGGAGVTLATLSPAIFLEGCGVSTIQAYIVAVDTAVGGVLDLLGDSALADQIQKAVAAVNTALSNWKSGTIPQMVVEALQALQAALDTVPLSNLLTAAINIAITAIDAILSISGAAVTNAKMVRSHRHPKPNQTLQTHRQFAKAWNSAIDNAGLPAKAKVPVPLF